MKKAQEFANGVDAYLTELIETFFENKGYFAQEKIPYLASQIPNLIKLALYFSIALSFLVFLKIFFPESRVRSFITYLVFVLINITLLGVFFGFFELLFSF